MTHGDGGNDRGPLAEISGVDAALEVLQLVAGDGWDCSSTNVSSVDPRHKRVKIENTHRSSRSA